VPLRELPAEQQYADYQLVAAAAGARELFALEMSIYELKGYTVVAT
jgi:hypothetical protein